MEQDTAEISDLTVERKERLLKIIQQNLGNAKSMRKALDEGGYKLAEYLEACKALQREYILE